MRDEFTITFRGHGVFPFGLWSNVVLGIAPLTFIQMFTEAVARHDVTGQWGTGVLFVLILPHATYLFLEVKHLLFKDGIADDRDYWGVFVFLLLSLLGLASAVTSILRGAHVLPFISQDLSVGIVFLSLLSAVGATIGLMDIPLLAGVFFPPIAIYCCAKILLSPRWLFVAALVWMLLMVICTGIELWAT